MSCVRRRRIGGSIGAGVEAAMNKATTPPFVHTVAPFVHSCVAACPRSFQTRKAAPRNTLPLRLHQRGLRLLNRAHVPHPLPENVINRQLSVQGLPASLLRMIARSPLLGLTVTLALTLPLHCSLNTSQSSLSSATVSVPPTLLCSYAFVALTNRSSIQSSSLP